MKSDPIVAPTRKKEAFRKAPSRKKPTNPQAPGRFDPARQPSIDPTQRG